MLDALIKHGWCRFAYDPVLAHWVAATLPQARRAVAAPENAQWRRCGGTWFAGVNVLGNDSTGAVPDGLPLQGKAIDFIANVLGLPRVSWDPAQVSVCYPRYPLPMPAESPAAYGYRRNRDAAHVDGLLREGPDTRRHLREHHAFVLGVPMAETTAGASPLVVWEGSHEVMRAAFAKLFAGTAPERWGDIDATESYHAARRQVFETCRRVTVEARPGEAYLVHRLALHGVAPWADGATAGLDGRMIVYFRPELSGPEPWLNAP